MRFLVGTGGKACWIHLDRYKLEVVLAGLKPASNPVLLAGQSRVRMLIPRVLSDLCSQIPIFEILQGKCRLNAKDNT